MSNGLCFWCFSAYLRCLWGAGLFLSVKVKQAFVNKSHIAGGAGCGRKKLLIIRGAGAKPTDLKRRKIPPPDKKLRIYIKTGGFDLRFFVLFARVFASYLAAAYFAA
jgi:hypothetical protein